MPLQGLFAQEASATDEELAYARPRQGAAGGGGAASAARARPAAGQTQAQVEAAPGGGTGTGGGDGAAAAPGARARAAGQVVFGATVLAFRRRHAAEGGPAAFASAAAGACGAALVRGVGSASALVVYTADKQTVCRFDVAEGLQFARLSELFVALGEDWCLQLSSGALVEELLCCLLVAKAQAMRATGDKGHWLCFVHLQAGAEPPERGSATVRWSAWPLPHDSDPRWLSSNAALERGEGLATPPTGRLAHVALALDHGARLNRGPGERLLFASHDLRTGEWLLVQLDVEWESDPEWERERLEQRQLQEQQQLEQLELEQQLERADVPPSPHEAESALAASVSLAARDEPARAEAQAQADAKASVLAPPHPVAPPGAAAGSGALGAPAPRGTGAVVALARIEAKLDLALAVRGSGGGSSVSNDAGARALSHADVVGAVAALANVNERLLGERAALEARAASAEQAAVVAVARADSLASSASRLEGELQAARSEAAVAAAASAESLASAASRLEGELQAARTEAAAAAARLHASAAAAQAAEAACLEERASLLSRCAEASRQQLQAQERVAALLESQQHKEGEPHVPVARVQRCLEEVFSSVEIDSEQTFSGEQVEKLLKAALKKTLRLINQGDGSSSSSSSSSSRST
jgi:hypothetical protein